MTEPARTAAIHDLGYQAYRGERRPQSARYRVIARNLIAMAWPGWWRLKLWVIAAVVITAVGAVVMYVFSNQIFRALQRQGVPLSLVDAVLPFTMSFYTTLAFILSLTTAAGVIASDLRAGAFEFYFARALRPIDYLAGKTLGVAGVIAATVLAGPLLLSVVRLGLTDSLAELPEQLGALPRAAAAGAIATAAYTLPPLACSALSTRRSHTMAAWALFYVVLGYLALAIAFATDTPAVAALDVKTAVMALSNALFEVEARGARLPPVWAAGTWLGLLCAASAALIYGRVAHAERAGLGGG